MKSPSAQPGPRSRNSYICVNLLILVLACAGTAAVAAMQKPSNGNSGPTAHDVILLLQEKIRRLQSENRALKAENADLTKRLDSLKTQKSASQEASPGPAAQDEKADQANPKP